jgi:hypothetical protein
MGKTNYFVDKADRASVAALMEAFDVRGTYFEQAIRRALSLHESSFILYVDYLNRPDSSPLDDTFTFNIETGELVLFSDEPMVLIDALIEMAMFVRGFDTRLGTGEEWEIQLAIGAWRYVRRQLKADLEIGPEVAWQVGVEPEAVFRFNSLGFGTALYLAGRPNVEVIFPDGSDAQVIIAYHRIRVMLSTVAFEISLTDPDIFNTRLARTIEHIRATLIPDDALSPFDDLIDARGYFNAGFFEDDPDTSAT